MKKKHLYLLFVMLSVCYLSNGQIRTVSIKDFGAKPDDGRSDQLAFNKAAAMINQRGGNVRLLIPAGKYLVGPTERYKNEADIPIGKVFDVMALLNCKNVFIEGKGNVQIVFGDDIPIGTIPNRTGKDSAVHIGALFRLTNCTDIKITNIRGDGNNQRLRLLKPWGVGTNPYEREHDGLLIFNSSNVQVTDASFMSFARDGGMIIEDQDKMPVKNISFERCNFNNNGRNGFSWCGGDDVKFSQCSFNNNCTGKIMSNPGGGLDIEPERGAVCRNGKFLKCTFRDNGGYGMGSTYHEASDVTFDSCTIIGKTIYSMMSQSPRFVFTNTTVAGTCIVSYDAENAKDGTRFGNCVFTDSLKGTVVYRENYMVSVQGRYIKFSDCRFENQKVPSLHTEIRKKQKLNDAENTTFENCFFYAAFKKSSTWDKLPFLLSNCNFVNCTFKTAGYADFKAMLNLPGKNLYEQQSKFIQ